MDAGLFAEVLPADLGQELAGETPAQIKVDYPNRWLRWVAPLLRWVLPADGQTAQVVLVIHRPAGRVLLAERPRHRLFALPTGGVKPGESVAEAAKREAEEETGLAVQLLGCPAVIRHQVGGRTLFRSYVVRLRDRSESRQAPYGDEVTRFCDVMPDELEALAGRWRRVREPLFGSLYGQFQARLLETVSQILRGETHAH